MKEYAIDTWRKYANRICQFKKLRDAKCYHKNNIGQCFQNDCPNMKLMKYRIEVLGGK